MSGRSQRILVVDDHPTNRLKLSMAVEQLGYDAATAENGHEALELLRGEPFDLMLLDIVMPVMDGYEVLAAIRDDAVLREVPVVVISSLEEMDAVAKAIELGAEDHLPKTFDPVVLKARVGACLAKKRLRDRELEYLAQVELLTDAAAAIEAQDFDPAHLRLDDVTARDDELGRLARVFIHMASVVRSREQQLKRELRTLQIRVDETRQKEQVRSITGTAYFKDLSRKAGDLRALLHGDEPE